MTVLPWYPLTPPLPSSPTLRSLALAEDEQALLGALQRKLSDDQSVLRLRDAYYNGEQVLTDLGISIPPELRGLRTMVGWPRLAVDALHERMDVEGFRLSSADDADTGLWEVWQGNKLDEEAPMAHMDCLIFGRSYVLVGTGEDPDMPLVTVESPLNLSGLWDARKRGLSAALQTYDVDGVGHAALYLPDETITIRHERGVTQWDVVDRDRHRLGVVPVLRMAHQARAHDRSGWPEINAHVMSITDAGCRTLLGLEVAREFYAAPQRFILGASEESFQDAAGNTKTAWETYTGRVLALERDEDGNVPQVGQFTPYSPEVYKTIIEMYANQMSSLTGLPPAYLGMNADANPASADAIRMSTDRLVKRVQRRQVSFGGAWEDAMRLAARFRGQTLPAATQIETIWANPEIPTPGATTDAIVKQIQAGFLPPTSDVAGEKLGYSPLQRRRLDAERRKAQGAAALSGILATVQGQAGAQGGAAGAQGGKPGAQGAARQPGGPIDPEALLATLLGRRAGRDGDSDGQINE